MEEVLVVIFFFLVLIPLVLAIVIPVYKNHIKVTGNIINYDTHKRCFVYKTYLSREEILKALQIVNAADELKCVLNSQESTIVFSEYGASIKYYFEVKQVYGFYIFKIEQIPYFATNGYIPIKLNSFIVQKLSAELVPFSEYGM